MHDNVISRATNEGGSLGTLKPPREGGEGWMRPRGVETTPLGVLRALEEKEKHGSRTTMHQEQLMYPYMQSPCATPEYIIFPHKRPHGKYTPPSPTLIYAPVPTIMQNNPHCSGQQPRMEDVPPKRRIQGCLLPEQPIVLKPPYSTMPQVLPNEQDDMYASRSWVTRSVVPTAKNVRKQHSHEGNEVISLTLGRANI